MKVIHVYNSIIPKLLRVEAITIVPFIFYRLKKLDTPSRLVFHEMVHVKQVRRIGWIRFYLSYFLYYLAGRVKGYPHFIAYYEIPYEKEAYQAENDRAKLPLT